MDPPPIDFRLLRFWSDELPADKRIAAWRDVLARKLLRLDVEPLSGQAFQVDASLRVLPGVRFGAGLFAASINRRTPEIVEADNDDIFALINLEGELTVAHGGEQISLGEGDACFLSCKQEGNFIRPGHGRLICVRFERVPLAALVPDLDGALGQAIRRGCEALHLLIVYMRNLDDNQALRTEELRRLAVAHIYDLAALALNPSGARANAVPSAGRLRAIKEVVAENQDRADFTIADAAAACRLSHRQVQRLFEAEDTTFSQFLLDKRLARIHAALTDKRQAHRSIAEIALARGFRDVSHFNRAFRRRYGASPTEIRHRDVAAR